MTTKSNDSKKQVKDSNKPVKHNYNGYVLTINRNDKSIPTVFSGKATKEISSISDTNEEVVLSELKQRIDDRESRFKESAHKISDQIIAPAKDNTSESSTPRLSSNSLENLNIGNTTKPEVNVENNNKKVTETIDISSVDKSLNTLIKNVEKINNYLDKPQPSIASQNNILDKISYLTKISNANKIDLDQLRKDYTEKSKLQETLLRDILTKINTLAQADHVSEHLTNLHNESKNLHDRLDNKIDLQDVEQILSLKIKIEESVNNQLITSVSEKIMPVVDILKRKVDGLDTTFSKSVDDLEQRCRQAGLIAIDKLF